MYAENNGVKIWYEVHGKGEPTLVMIPGFQIVHSEIFKRPFVPFLSRHMRVVTLDVRGSGKSAQPGKGYDLETYVEDVHAVVGAAHLDRFAMAGHSCGFLTIIKYHATHPGRVSHLISLNGFARMVQSEDYSQGMPKEVLEGAIKIWRDQPEAMLKGFIEMACSEKYSLRHKELIWEWAHETSPKIWEMGFAASTLSDVDKHLKNIDLSVLIFHGQKDKIVFPAASDYLHQKIPGSRFIPIPDSGHGFIRTWPHVSLHILDFLKPEMRKPSPQRRHEGPPRILWVSSPIGLGHVKRDLAIAEELRKKMPDLSIHWLCVDPVRSFLEGVGEEIHPLSEALWDENGHFESYGKAYSLDATEAYWEMDKLLNNNFMVFTDAVREDGYDLVVGDESWEVDQYLHYNPSLKTAPFVFMTDFVGASNVSEDKTKRAHVYNVNGTWVEMREVHPEASDLSIFIGDLEDIPDRPFGEGLPNMREWAKEHFRFPGYVLPFDPTDYSDRQALRRDLGFSPEDKILLVAVGGTSVGRPLIEKCLEVQPILKEKIPGIRIIVLCGPRIDPKSFGQFESVEFLPFVRDPIKYHAACDLAVIQGGLSTAMELTALSRRFLYFPLKNHFEQQDYVPFRLKRYNAGVRMDFDGTSPSELAEAIRNNMGTSVNYAPVNTNGAKKAASMIIELLQKGES
ncbi:MAG: alpha/beta fold hydrolase [Desulfobacteraceae bacterium]|nr:alpha/beta fold hydrolase [Desulfobacteraceae bacterium]